MSTEEHDEQGWSRRYPYYTAEVVKQVDNGKGFWNYLDIQVWEHRSKDVAFTIGEPYRRNYSSFMDTFCYVRKGDRHFALYSPSYTCTRIMEITPGVGWKDIGGEEKDSGGFCPTGYFVPSIREFIHEDDVHPEHKIKDWSRLLEFYPPGSSYEPMGDRWKMRQKICYSDGKVIMVPKKLPGGGTSYSWVHGPEREWENGFVTLPPQHGSVSGCYWGDDSSWKIQYLDLTRIEEGILKREERFGYVELPSKMKLKDAVETMDLSEHSAQIRMAVELPFDINTGDCLVYDDALWERMVAARAKYDEEQKKHPFHSHFDEMSRRWEEHGDQIRKEVEAMGGTIG